MAKYRKKPVVVEAVRFDPKQHPWPEGVKPWPNEMSVQPRDMSHGYIQTLEGTMHVMAGDWIIRGVAGELYPCKNIIFRATYEPVEKETAEELHAIGVVSALNALRLAIDLVIEDVRRLAGCIQYGPGSDELALAIMFLRQGRQWIREALEEVERETAAHGSEPHGKS